MRLHTIKMIIACDAMGMMPSKVKNDFYKILIKCETEMLITAN